MSLNCNEINLIIQELNLTGAFIQDIIQPGFDTLALYTYKEGTAKTVLICTAQNSVRLNETRKKITKNDKPLRFMEFLRSRIKGCRINSFEQIGVERIVKMELSRTVVIKDKPNEKTNSIKLASTAFNLSNTAVSNSKIREEEINESYILYIKLWNNAANIILCTEDNIILEPMFRRPERKEIKDEIFILPEIKLEKIAEAETKFPVRDWPANQSSEDINQGKPFNSFNSYVDYWYSEHADNLSRESLLEKAEKWYNINLSKKESALENLLKKQNEFANAEQLKHQGDLILSYGHLIQPESKYLECEDYETGKTLRLLIDPNKTAQENAAQYYKNYKKAISGAEEITHDIEIAKTQIEKLKKQYEEILNEKNPVKIEQILRKDSKPKQQIKKSHPGLDYTINGWLLLVGRDANENDELLRHHVRGDDLWLHVRDFPGGYVFIKARKGKTVPLDILLDGANLAIYYSKARNAGTTDLYYTHVKYLRRAQNGPKGLVIPTQEKNLCVTPDKDRLKRLQILHAEKEGLN